MQRSAAESWSQLSDMMASSAAAARMEAMRKAEVGASLQVCYNTHANTHTHTHSHFCEPDPGESPVCLLCKAD